MGAALAFLPLLPTSGPRVVGRRCRISVEPAGRKHDRRRLTFAISRELAQALSWQPGDRVVIALGLGADRGRAQLARVDKPTAGHKLTTYRQSHVLRVSVSTPTTLQGEDVAPLLDAFLTPAGADFAIADGTLLVTLSPLNLAAAQPALRTVA